MNTYNPNELSDFMNEIIENANPHSFSRDKKIELVTARHYEKLSKMKSEIKDLILEKENIELRIKFREMLDPNDYPLSDKRLKEIEEVKEIISKCSQQVWLFEEYGLIIEGDLWQWLPFASYKGKGYMLSHLGNGHYGYSQTIEEYVMLS